MSPDLLLYALAFAFFVCGGCNVPAPVRWEPLGFAALTATLIV
jgi:hypothetical protein